MVQKKAAPKPVAKQNRPLDRNTPNKAYATGGKKPPMPKRGGTVKY